MGPSRSRGPRATTVFEQTGLLMLLEPVKDLKGAVAEF